MQQEQIAQQIAAIRERIAAAAGRAGRSPDTITLIAVTKTHPADFVALALAAGITDCGENRVQEAEAKLQQLRDVQPRWHLIGHLQRNKARRAAMLFTMIHSLDSVKLAEALARYRAEAAPLHPELAQPRLPVLLQVNVSGETTKDGFDLVGGVDNQAALERFTAAARQIAALPQLEVQGLMTIAPYADDPEQARPIFQSLRRLRDRLTHEIPEVAWQHLSMGMTGDFEVAIEEGATLVRVGRAIFGERD